jgi:hypothetical protein
MADLLLAHLSYDPARLPRCEQTGFAEKTKILLQAWRVVLQEEK